MVGADSASSATLGGDIAVALLRRAPGGHQAAMEGALRALASRPPQVWLECARRLLRDDAAPAAGTILQRALQRWPADLELRYWQGNACRQAGDRAGAERLLREVLAARPDHEDAALSLAFLLRDWARFSAAAEVAVELRRRQGGGAEATKRCVRFLKECRRNEIAVAVCHEELAAGCKDPMLLDFAGSLEMSLGRFARAREYFEQALHEQPLEYEPLFCIAQMQRYRSPDDPDIARLRAAIANPAAAEQERALAEYGLGKALDDVGAYAEAAAVFRHANAVIGRTGRWDGAAWARFVDANAGFQIARLTAPVATDITPVFVIGLPRTGTTLVADRLGRHPLARNRDELNWIDYIYRRLVEHPPDERGLRNAAAMYLAFLREDDAPARWYIDKNPLNFRYLNLIDALFPNARIIHCRRNLRDTALSIWMQHFSHEDNDYAYDFGTIRHFFAGYERLTQAWMPRLRVPVMEIDYERLVGEPEAALAGLREFLGLPPAAPDSGASAGAIGTASVWQVRQPVYQRSVRRWSAYAEELPELLALPESSRELGWPQI